MPANLSNFQNHLPKTQAEVTAGHNYRLYALNSPPIQNKTQPTAHYEASETESGHNPPSNNVKVLTLEDAINRALIANRGLVSALDSLEGAQLSIVAASAEFELKLIPGGQAGVTAGTGEDIEKTIGAGITLHKLFPFGSNINVSPGIQRAGDTYQTEIGVEFTQPLLLGLSREFNLSGVLGAEFSARSSSRALYLTRVNTVLATVFAVYEVIRQRELVKLNEDSAERLRWHVEATKVKERIGLATPIDAYRAAIQLKNAEDTLITVLEVYRDALDNLRVLLDLPLEEEIKVAAPLSYSLLKMTEDKVVKVALNTRVELDQAADALLETRRQSRVAKHITLPELNVNFNYSRFGAQDALGQSMSLDEEVWGIGLQTSTDLRRTAEHASYKQSLLSVKASERDQGLLKDEIVKNSKREFRFLRRSEKRITLQKEQITQAEGKLELSRVKFRYGLANNFDLVEAESELRQAQTNLLSAVLDYILGSYRLRAAMGTLVEKPAKF